MSWEYIYPKNAFMKRTSYYYREIWPIIEVRNYHAQLLHELLIEQIPKRKDYPDFENEDENEDEDREMSFSSSSQQPTFEEYQYDAWESIAPHFPLLFLDFIAGWCVMMDEILMKVCKEWAEDKFNEKYKDGWKWTDSRDCLIETYGISKQLWGEYENVVTLRNKLVHHNGVLVNIQAQRACESANQYKGRVKNMQDKIDYYVKHGLISIDDLPLKQSRRNGRSLYDGGGIHRIAKVNYDYCRFIADEVAPQTLREICKAIQTKLDLRAGTAT